MEYSFKAPTNHLKNSKSYSDLYDAFVNNKPYYAGMFLEASEITSLCIEKDGNWSIITYTTCPWVD